MDNRRISETTKSINPLLNDKNIHLEPVLENTSWMTDNYQKGIWEVKGRKKYETNGQGYNHTRADYDILKNGNDYSDDYLNMS